uniref:Chromosome partition protein Smc n=1 Tax=Talaromyces marneffei PM1 TaxID=1077442 RepID=A0A093VDB7_TALMA
MRNSGKSTSSNPAMASNPVTASNPQMQLPTNLAPHPSRNIVVPWDLLRDLIQREMSLKDHVSRLEQSVNRLGYMNQQERISYNQLEAEYDHLKASYTELVEQKTVNTQADYPEGSFRVPAPAPPSNFEKILNFE